MPYQISHLKHKKVHPHKHCKEIRKSEQSRVYWTAWPLNMEPKICPETSVINFHYTLRKIPEEINLKKSLTLQYKYCSSNCIA